MKCSEVRELLSAYHDGELAMETRSQVKDHLNGCADCATELAGFEKISAMTSSLRTPTPPQHMWSNIEQRLDERPKARAEKRAEQAFPVPRVFALAATVLIAVTAGWFAYQTWFSHGEHGQFAAEFGHYLEEFRRDPDAAQQILLAKYEGHLVQPEQAIQQVGYRPAIADGLPEGYTVDSTYVMKMPCCTCVQTLCKRSDGSTLAIFEHDDEDTEWFGTRPEIRCRCNGRHCCLVELDDRIAATWKHGKRHMTLIGVRDVSEVNQMVAWFDDKQKSITN